MHASSTRAMPPRCPNMSRQVSPSHDANDYECSLRLGLPLLDMMRDDGTVCPVWPDLVCLAARGEDLGLEKVLISFVLR